MHKRTLERKQLELKLTFYWIKSFPSAEIWFKELTYRQKDLLVFVGNGHLYNVQVTLCLYKHTSK